MISYCFYIKLLLGIHRGLIPGLPGIRKSRDAQVPCSQSSVSEGSVSTVWNLQAWRADCVFIEKSTRGLTQFKHTVLRGPLCAT